MSGACPADFARAPEAGRSNPAIPVSLLAGRSCQCRFTNVKELGADPVLAAVGRPGSGKRPSWSSLVDGRPFVRPPSFLIRNQAENQLSRPGSSRQIQHLLRVDSRYPPGEPESVASLMVRLGRRDPQTPGCDHLR